MSKYLSRIGAQRYIFQFELRINTVKINLGYECLIKVYWERKSIRNKVVSTNAELRPNPKSGEAKFDETLIMKNTLFKKSKEAQFQRKNSILIIKARSQKGEFIVGMVNINVSEFANMERRSEFKTFSLLKCSDQSACIQVSITPYFIANPDIDNVSNMSDITGHEADSASIISEDFEDQPRNFQSQNSTNSLQNLGLFANSLTQPFDIPIGKPPKLQSNPLKLQGRIFQLEKENNELKNKVAQLQVKTDTEELGRQLATIREERDYYIQECQQKQSLIAQFQKQKGEVSEEYKDLQDQFNEINARMLQQKQENENKTREIRKLKQKIEDLEFETNNVEQKEEDIRTSYEMKLQEQMARSQQMGNINHDSQESNQIKELKSQNLLLANKLESIGQDVEINQLISKHKTEEKSLKQYINELEGKVEDLEVKNTFFKKVSQIEGGNSNPNLLDTYKLQNTQLTDKNSHLKNELRQAQQRIQNECYHDHSQSLQELQITQFKSEIQKLQTELEKEKQNNENLNQVVKQLDMQVQNTSSNEQFQQLKDEIKSLETALVAKKTVEQELRQEVILLQKNDIYEQELTKLERENQQLKTRIRELENKNSEGNNYIQLLRPSNTTEIENLKQSLQKQQEENQSTTQKLKTIQKEYSKIEQQYTETQMGKDTAELARENLEQKLQDIQKMLTSYEQQIKYLEEQLVQSKQKLGEQLNDLYELDNENAKLRKQIENQQ